MFWARSCYHILLTYYLGHISVLFFKSDDILLFKNIHVFKI